MPKISHPRRSVLYTPGANARALEKGRSVPADGLIFDLEDAVAIEAKELARNQVVAALSQGGYGHREVLIRVNTLNSPWGRDDIVAISKSGADGILLPKVESADVVRMAAELMSESGAPDGMSIWCMMETPLGTLHAEEIAFASPRMGGFIMGTSDLAKDLHATHTRQRLPMLTSLGFCLLAARAAGLAAVDGVYLNINDDEGFEHACHQGIELGFDGKTLIHPKTIKTANRIFSPSEDEIVWSKIIIKAHAEAEARGEGVVVVDGKLIENLHVANAKRQVAMAEIIAEREESNR